MLDICIQGSAAKKPKKAQYVVIVDDKSYPFNVVSYEGVWIKLDNGVKIRAGKNLDPEGVAKCIIGLIKSNPHQLIPEDEEDDVE